MTEAVEQRSTLERLQYPFERNRQTRQHWDEAREMRELLAARLGIKALDDVPEPVLELMLKYATSSHLNIVWYAKQRAREQRKWLAFLAVSLMVVAGTPLAVILISQSLGADVLPMLTAVLAGVLGAQQSIGSLFEQRRRVGMFWKAEAELKTDLYEFEDRWRGAVLLGEASSRGKGRPGEVSPDFVTDLKVRIQNAQRIRREEQDDFFSRFDRSPIDISRVMGTAQRDASDAVQAFKPARPTRAETEGEVEALQRTLDDLEARIRSRVLEIQTLEGDKSDLARTTADALASEIRQLRAKRLEAELDLNRQLAQLGKPDR